VEQAFRELRENLKKEDRGDERVEQSPALRD
jgi:hypothetical protein